MPTFISSIDALQGNDNMQEVNYIDLRESLKEMLRSDLWTVDFTPPNAVFYPGIDIFRKRIKSVSPSIPGSITGIEETIRGFAIKQKTTVTTDGSVTIEVMDREDQSLHVFADDWRNKISDRDNRFSFRKEDTYANMTQTFLNSGRVPIRKLDFLVMQPSDLTFTENAEGEASNMGNFSINLDFEHYQRTFLNI